MRVKVLSMKRLVVAMAIATSLSGCASTGVLTGSAIPASVSQEGRYAIQARAVIATADGILTATEAAVNAKLMTQQQGLLVAQTTRQLGIFGQRLATVLRVMDAANTTLAVKAEAVAEAQTLLNSMSSAVTAIPVAIRSVLAEPVGSFTYAVDSLRSLLSL